jgi:hypothetical protein
MNNMSDTIINRVAESSLTEIDPATFYPQGEVMLFDMKDYLFMGLILKEKDFREALKAKDFSVYRDKYVAVFCSADAIIPLWAYMLVASYLQPFAKDMTFGDEQALHRYLFIKNISALDVEAFRDKRVVVKGCGDLPIGEFAYLELTKLLRPVAKSIMYGEPCSTVPIYKKPAGTQSAT